MRPYIQMLPPQVSNMINGVERRQDDFIAQLYLTEQITPSGNTTSG